MTYDVAKKLTKLIVDLRCSLPACVRILSPVKISVEGMISSEAALLVVSIVVCNCVLWVSLSDVVGINILSLVRGNPEPSNMFYCKSMD